MQQQVLKKLCITILFGLSFLPASAVTPGLPNAAQYAEKTNSQIKANWFVSNNIHAPVQVSFDIADDGTIYNPTIEKSSSDPQLDGECLAAVCFSSPLEPLPSSLRTGKTFQIALTFEPNTEAKRTPVLAEYRRANYLQKFEFSTFRTPPVVLLRFPGAFKPSEIFNIDNIRKSDSGDIVGTSHLWSLFFKEHPFATREELLIGP